MDNGVKERRWGRRVAFILAVIFIPLIVGYFVATSEPFLKNVILPRAGKALNAKITVADASIKPFSQIVLRGVRVQTTGSEPLATVQEARVRHSLVDILRQNIKVHEVVAVAPVIHVITNPDGSSNLDPLFRPDKPSKESDRDKKPGKPMRLDIGQIRIEKGAFRKTQLVQNDPSQVTEVADFNLTLANVKNGGSGSLDFDGRVLGQVEGALRGKLQFELAQNLFPASASGAMGVTVDRARAPMQDLSGFAANLTCDVAPDSVKQFALAFQKNQQPLGELRARGPFSIARQEGRLTLELLGIDQRLLDLIGARRGMDFGETKIQSTNTIELGRAGNHLRAAGALAISGFSITRTNQRTPAVNLDLNYSAEIDRGARTIELEKLQLAGTQNQKPLIRGDLAQPLSVSWGQSSTGLPDSGMKLAITGFRFADWKALLGEVPEGSLDANLEVQSRESGRLLALVGTAEVSGLMLTDPERQQIAKPLEAKMRIDSSMREKVFELTELGIALTPTQLAKNAANVNGRIDLSRPKAITGRLALASEALDLTGYYDLFAGDEKTKKKKTGRAAPSPPQSTKPSPEKQELPFKDFVLDAKIGHVFLREVSATNVLAGMRIDGSRVDMKPISLVLNGAPVNGAIALDLARDSYDLAMKLDAVPIEPLANSFASEYRGRAKGALNGNFQIKGVGTTGASLQKTLQGQITASCTNGQIQLVGKKMRPIVDSVAMLLRVGEIRTAPLTAFDARVKLGAGKIQIEKLDLISEAFTAHTEGAIPIADVLTNSRIPKLPITFALSRDLADRANLIPANAPTNTAYVPLPPFLYLTGTLGKPDTDRNEAAIAGIIARSQVLPRIGGDLGKAIGNILGGAQGTNAPATNQPLNPGTLLEDLLKRKPK